MNKAVTKEKKMHSLCKTCPTCGSNNTKVFENGYCAIMPKDTMPHYSCINCKTLWGIGRPSVERAHAKQAS